MQKNHNKSNIKILNKDRINSNASLTYSSFGGQKKKKNWSVESDAGHVVI